MSKKTKPVPTRFDAPEDKALADLKRKTGLAKAEIVRRSVRLLAATVKERGSVGFILDELAPEENPRITTDEAIYPAQKKGQGR